MAVFYIGSYDIVDPEEFQKYPPLVLALLPKYGGVVLASDTAAHLLHLQSFDDRQARTIRTTLMEPATADTPW